MSNETLSALVTVFCFAGVTFIVGTWYGLLLLVTHMARMRRWAGKVVAIRQAEEAAGVHGIACRPLDPMGVE